MGNLLKKIALRKQIPPAKVRIVAELCTQYGLTAEAARLCEEVLKKGESDENYAKYKTWARSQLVDIGRRQGKFQEAAGEAVKLVDENPRSLEPRIVLARILEAWAEKDPKQYDEAVKRWSQVRNLLDPVKNKKEFAESYFDANYHAALCFFQRAKQLQPVDRNAAVEKAAEAGKLLTSALFQSRSHIAPDLAAKYTALRDEIKVFLAKNKQA